jgi:ABC-type transport system involved in multi-copper enzyme maturation permease subunit
MIQGRNNVPEYAAFVNAFQVAIGLLLFTGAAVTVLAEERAKGSLDLLLVTPLSTWAILAGKWFGNYRTVLLLSILPTVIAGYLGWHAYANWSGVDLRERKPADMLLVPGLVLAYGAGITSLGLALATWISRLGRAVALCTAAYLFVSAGWIFLLLIASRFFPVGNNDFLLQFLGGSPWYGVGAVTASLERPGMARIMDALRLSDLIWMGVYAVGAAALFMLTLATFNRCTGRMPYGTTRRTESGSGLPS